jgi:lysozyme
MMQVFVLGADVSHWNEYDLVDLWNAGYRFLYIKVTDGDWFVDPKWREWYDRATQIGFKVGPYHYFRPEINGALQAELFFETASEVEWHMKPMLDVEERYDGVPSPPVYAARVKNTLYEIEARFGRKPIVYTSKYIWDTFVDTYVENELFVAHWTTRPEPLIPEDWEGRGYTIWQFGVEVIDRDRFRGDAEEFAAWIQDIEVPDPVDTLEKRVAYLENTVIAQDAMIESLRETADLLETTLVWTQKITLNVRKRVRRLKKRVEELHPSE